MSTDPLTPPRLALKRPLDSHSGETPTPKRIQRAKRDSPEPESEGDSPESPTVPISKRTMPKSSKHSSKKLQSTSKPRPSPPIRLSLGTRSGSETPHNTTPTPSIGPMSPLPLAYLDGNSIPPGSPPLSTTTLESLQPEGADPLQPQAAAQVQDTMNTELSNETSEPIDDELKDTIDSLEDEWNADTTTGEIDISAIYGFEPVDQILNPAPTRKTAKSEWLIIRKDASRPELDHQTDNPFDFWPATTVSNLIRHWRGDSDATSKLSATERNLLGNPRAKLILAKLVYTGTDPLEEAQKNTWIRSAIISAIAQNGAEEKDFSKSRCVVNPAKPGYSWVVIPVGSAAFKAMENTRGALDTGSGTLVLFRRWELTPFSTQRIYAFGIHYINDATPFETAKQNYTSQLAPAFAEKNMKILDVTPTRYGDAKEYGAKITFGFTEKTTPFLINPRILPRRIWTAAQNTSPRYISYKWPAKCRLCESEAHITEACPWPNLELSGRKPNFVNCSRRPPGWTETAKDRRSRYTVAKPMVSTLGPRPARNRATTSEAKGKGREMEIDTSAT